MVAVEEKPSQQHGQDALHESAQAKESVTLSHHTVNHFIEPLIAFAWRDCSYEQQVMMMDNQSFNMDQIQVLFGLDLHMFAFTEFSPPPAVCTRECRQHHHDGECDEGSRECVEG